MKNSILNFSSLMAAVALTALLIGVARFSIQSSLWKDGAPLLFQWDSGHYYDLAQKGYGSHIPGLRAPPYDAEPSFFPGYPLLSRWISRGLSLDLKLAMLLVSTLSTIVFWTLVSLLLMKWRVPVWTAIAGVFALVAHPASFFLIAAYSEALYLAAILGVFYTLWNGNLTARNVIIASACGFLASSTRVTGVSVVPVPLCIWFCGILESRGLLYFAFPNVQFSRVILITFISIAGILSFFIFCQWHFGAWDIYFTAQSVGWGIVPNHKAIFQLSTYTWSRPELNDPESISRASVPILTILFLVVVAADVLLTLRTRNTQVAPRVALYLCAAINFYVPLSGLADQGMRSMVRYGYVPYVLIVLALLHLISRPSLRVTPISKLASVCLLTLGAVGAFALVSLCETFLTGGWVA